jgi:hypothetical protein
MPAASQQLALPFACLDLPGRATVTVAEIAEKLSCHPDHIANLVDDGRLHPLDIKRERVSRRAMRVTIHEYRRFILSIVPQGARKDFLAELPPDDLRELLTEISRLLSR